jgi:hypothetical protein
MPIESEIQSWISTAVASNENDDTPDAFAWRTDNVLKDWPQAMTYAQGRLLTSKTRPRIQFLQEELLPLTKYAGMILSSFPVGIHTIFGAGRPELVADP